MQWGDHFVQAVTRIQRRGAGHGGNGLDGHPRLAGAPVLHAQLPHRPLAPRQEQGVGGQRRIQGTAAAGQQAAGLGLHWGGCGWGSAAGGLQRLPIQGVRGGIEHGGGVAADRVALIGAAELAQRQPGPQVGGGGGPGPAFLPRQQAGDQAGALSVPLGLADGGQQQAGGVYVRPLHQPPPVVLRVGRKAHLRALVGQAVAQDLPSLLLPLGAARHLHVFEHGEPVQHAVRGPAHGVDVQAVQQRRGGFAIERQGGNGAQLACGHILLRAPERALQFAGDKGNQGLLHLRLLGRRQGKARIGLAHEVREGEQVRRQRVTALAARPIGQGEIHGQAIVIQVRGQAAHDAAPQIRIVQPHRSAGGLLQAAVGVALPPGAQTGHALLRVGQALAERQAQAAFAQHGLGGPLHRHVQAALHLHQRGLLHR